MSRVIALLTDFGLDDIYVGVMKAVILGICPGAAIVDISHGIGAQNLRGAAFGLANSYGYFPRETIFCVVVDPGVGSARLPVAVNAGEYTFVAPDNGVLSYALARIGGEPVARSLEESRFHARQISHTFHGRDIFAPVSAHLARSPAVFSELGPVLERLEALDPPELSFARQRYTGEVMHIDRFGNIISSIGVFAWQDSRTLALSPIWDSGLPGVSLRAAGAHVSIHSHTVHGISRAYHEAAPGGIMAQIDSGGFLEIGANQASAAQRLDAQIGDKVTLRLAD